MYKSHSKKTKIGKCCICGKTVYHEDLAKDCVKFAEFYMTGLCSECQDFVFKEQAEEE